MKEYVELMLRIRTYAYDNDILTLSGEEEDFNDPNVDNDGWT